MKTILPYIFIHIIILLPSLGNASAPGIIIRDDDDNKFTLIREEGVEESFSIKNGTFIYSGPVSGLVKYLLNISSYQIMFHNMTDYGIIMECGTEEIRKAKTNPLAFIEKRLSLEIESETMDIDANILHVEDDILLENYTAEKNQELLSINDLSSDNIRIKGATLTEIANSLTDITHRLYYYPGEITDRYKWFFDTKNPRHIETELKNKYGILLQKTNLKLPVFVVSPLLGY